MTKKKKLTKVKNIGKLKRESTTWISLWIKIFVYGWLYFTYNKYKHLRDNKYNFMKKKLMHSVHNILEQA